MEIQIIFGVVVRGDFVELADFVREPEPESFSVRIKILDVHAGDGADVGKTVNHDRYGGAVTKSDRGGSVSAKLESVTEELNLNATLENRTSFVTICLNPLGLMIWRKESEAQECHGAQCGVKSAAKRLAPQHQTERTRMLRRVGTE